MTTTHLPVASQSTADSSRPQDSRDRINVRAAGAFYVLTFAASIPAWIMLSPVLTDAGYITSAGQDTQVTWACLLDFVTALTGIATAVAVYPVIKRVNNSLALGFVMSRMLEAAIIMIGVVALLAVVTLRQDFAGSAVDASSLTVTGQALVAVRDWTFLFGPGFMASVNALLFGTVLFRSRLVPRVIPAIGLIGAPVLLVANMLTLFGHNTQAGGWTMLATLPIATWELSIGFYMLIKGFKR